MKTIRKKLHTIKYKAPDYGFSALANEWIPGNDENNGKLIKPLLTSAVLYFSPSKELCPRVQQKKKKNNTDYAALVLAGIAVGDMAGQPYEGCGCQGEYDPQKNPTAYRSMPLVRAGAHITDDTVLATAVLDAAMSIRKEIEQKKTTIENVACVYRYERSLRDYAQTYPDAGYGGAFYHWAILGEAKAGYKSYGNGGAMRVGIIGAMFDTIDDVICQAVMSALPTHSHPEGIKGAVVTAVAVFLALHGIGKKSVLEYMESCYQEKDLDGIPYKVKTDMTLDFLARVPYTFASVKTQDTLPEAIIHLKNSDGYESCIRNIFRYICDSDTIGAISGGIAAALYPKEFQKICSKIQPCEGMYRVLTKEILDNAAELTI